MWNHSQLLPQSFDKVIPYSSSEQLGIRISVLIIPLTVRGEFCTNFINHTGQFMLKDFLFSTEAGRVD
jgi:hypothetical protein